MACGARHRQQMTQIIKKSNIGHEQSRHLTWSSALDSRRFGNKNSFGAGLFLNNPLCPSAQLYGWGGILQSGYDKWWFLHLVIPAPNTRPSLGTHESTEDQIEFSSNLSTNAAHASLIMVSGSMVWGRSMRILPVASTVTNTKIFILPCNENVLKNKKQHCNLNGWVCPFLEQSIQRNTISTETD